jgi:hypothetical protein
LTKKMNTKELIKLAYKADIEGDLELADFIDRELLAISNNKNIKEAALTDTLGKMGRGVGNFFGNIGNFLGGYGGYNGPTNNAGARKLVEQAPQFKGLGKTFGAVTQEVRHTPDELAELANGLKKSMINSRSKATPEVQAAMDTLMDGKAIGTKAHELLRQHAIQNKIINPRSALDLEDFTDLMNGRPLKLKARNVQRVNKNTKLLGGGAAAAIAAPGIYNAFAPQAPDTTGSAIPDGPAMTGMPQLNPGMGGFGGGYNGPQAGPPQGNNYNPQQNIGMGSVNSAIDPKSFKESAGVAPKTEYSERNERGINPAARFRSYEGMTRGESAPVYNYNNYNAGYNPGPQSAVSPIQTPVAPVAAPVANVAQLESIPPVTIPTAQGLAGQTGFGGATDSAGIAAELFGDQAPPQPPPMTPEQIQSTMNPLATVGY